MVPIKIRVAITRPVVRVARALVATAPAAISAVEVMAPIKILVAITRPAVRAATAPAVIVILPIKILAINIPTGTRWVTQGTSTITITGASTAATGGMAGGAAGSSVPMVDMTMMELSSATTPTTSATWSSPILRIPEPA
jgi:hypothetical protein